MKKRPNCHGILSPTTIPPGIHRFSSDHQSGGVSTWMGDSLGIPHVVGFFFSSSMSCTWSEILGKVQTRAPKSGPMSSRHKLHARTHVCVRACA